MAVALAIFSVISLIFASQLVGNYRVYSASKDHSLAEELASEAIEEGRNFAYADLGTNPGNPPGVIPRDAIETVNGVAFDVTTTIQLVDDPIPGGFTTHANYKRMRVAVSRDGVVLADMSTIVAPPKRASLTRGTIRVLVSDYANNTPIGGATVNVGSGPSPNRSDYSDASGRTMFADLLATTTAKPNYEITASSPGYSVLPEDQPPAPAVKPTLAPSQLFSTTVRMFKTVTVTANLVKPNGDPFLYDSMLTITSSRGSETVAVTGGTIDFSTVGAEPVIPSTSYTLSATSSIAGAPVSGAAETQVVPNQYPDDLTSTYNIVMPPPPPKNLTVHILSSAGGVLTGIPVLVTGGDDNVTVSGVSNAAGDVVFALSPSVLPYTVGVPSQTLSQTVQVSTVDVSTSFTLIVPQMVFAFRDTLGAPIPNLAFLIGGGDTGVLLIRVTNAAGEATMTLPASTKPYFVLSLAWPGVLQQFYVTTPTTYVVFMTPSVEVRVKGQVFGEVKEQAGLQVLVTGGDLNVQVSAVTGSDGRADINLPDSVLPYTFTVPAQRGFAASSQTEFVNATTDRKVEFDLSAP